MSKHRTVRPAAAESGPVGGAAVAFGLKDPDERVSFELAACEMSLAEGCSIPSYRPGPCGAWPKHGSPLAWERSGSVGFGIRDEVIAVGEMRDAMRSAKRAMGELNKQVPEEMKCFTQFMGTVLKPGKLDLKTKELIALGMGLTARCKYCIGIHTEKALKAGATPDELWEVATVAMMMGGGPALTYVAELQKAIEELAGPATKE